GGGRRVLRPVRGAVVVALAVPVVGDEPAGRFRRRLDRVAGDAVLFVTQRDAVQQCGLAEPELPAQVLPERLVGGRLRGPSDLADDARCERVRLFRRGPRSRLRPVVGRDVEAGALAVSGGVLACRAGVEGGGQGG